MTPAAAVHEVKRALSARDAEAVDGISASRAPKPNQLVPLDRSGHLPAAVLPVGLRGPRGAQGPRGVPGIAQAIVRRRDGRVSIGFPVESSVDVISLPLPSAGNWLLRTETQVGYFADVPVADYFDCRYVIGGVAEPPLRQKGVFVGPAADATRLAQVSHTAIATVAGSTVVSLRCNHITNLPAGSTPPFFERTVATALQVDRIDYQELPVP